MVGAGLSTFANARARPTRLDALADLIAAEPPLARAVGSIVELARRDVAPIETHVVGGAQTTLIPRGDAATWIARMMLGSVEPAAALHPELDCAPLLGTAIPSERAKLRCMLAYFERATAELPRGTLRFERLVVPARASETWQDDASPLLPIDVRETGAIEDAMDCRQVDFANRFLGGGVIRGNVQEEIRFAIAPELLVGMIVSPLMRHDEAIAMRGSEMFAAYRGYGGTLAYAGPFHDPAPRLDDGTPDIELVAIDAVDYRRGDRAQQFTESAVVRELCKARAGFVRDSRQLPIATGNWGCGAFCGDPPHKAILQWLAASAEGRSLRYFTFGDVRVGDLAGFSRDAIARFGTVGALYERVMAVARTGAPLYAAILAG